MHNVAPCDRKMGIRTNHVGSPYHPVMPEFIKWELLKCKKMHCAVVAVISSKTDAGCSQCLFAFGRFVSLIAVQPQCDNSQSGRERLVKVKQMQI